VVAGANDDFGNDGTELLATTTKVVPGIVTTVTPAGTEDALTITGLGGNEDFGGIGNDLATDYGTGLGLATGAGAGATGDGDLATGAGLAGA
jgi:hypothetical protein